MSQKAESRPSQKLKFQKAGNVTYEEVLKIVRSVERELKENPELAEKLQPQVHERVF